MLHRHYKQYFILIKIITSDLNNKEKTSNIQFRGDFPMKKFEIIFIAAIALFLCLSGIRDVNDDYLSLQNDVVRMHILANSDSEEDQNLKLQVRDRILEGTRGWTEGCTSAEEAESVYESRIDEINSMAQQYVYEAGYDYETRTEVLRMDFDDREYGDITMPQGNYSAVRITIGEAEGHNWWCVMYPPLCVPAAGAQSDIDSFSGYFTDGEIDLMKNCGKYKLKLRCAEIYNRITGAL